jgi:hypothetical protein
MAKNAFTYFVVIQKIVNTSIYICMVHTHFILFQFHNIQLGVCHRRVLHKDLFSFSPLTLLDEVKAMSVDNSMSHFVSHYAH